MGARARWTVDLGGAGVKQKVPMDPAARERRGAHGCGHPSNEGTAVDVSASRVKVWFGLGEKL
jgi:hypothetical protein